MRFERPRPPKASPLTRPAKKPARRVLVIGIGNPGRGDDGLGPAAAERLESLNLAGVTCDANYQLAVEDALACSRQDVVIFVDAAKRLRGPYSWRTVRPQASVPALTHALGPGAVLGICAALYGRSPEARLLAVRGYRWGVGEGLSPRAEKNLAEAVRAFREFVTRGAAKRGRAE